MPLSSVLRMPTTVEEPTSSTDVAFASALEVAMVAARVWAMARVMPLEMVVDPESGRVVSFAIVAAAAMTPVRVLVDALARADVALDVPVVCFVVARATDDPAVVDPVTPLAIDLAIVAVAVIDAVRVRANTRSAVRSPCGDDVDDSCFAVDFARDADVATADASRWATTRRMEDAPVTDPAAIFAVAFAVDAVAVMDPDSACATAFKVVRDPAGESDEAAVFDVDLMMLPTEVMLPDSVWTTLLRL